MKSTKKLLSLLLVFVMVFSLAVPVFAEGETPATATLASWSGGTSVANNGENDILKDVALVMKDNGEGLNQYNSLGVTTSTYGNLSAQPWYGTNNFSETNYGYIEFKAATKGYESLALTTVLGNNGKAPVSYSVLFSVDGGSNWVEAEAKLTAPSEKANTLEKAITSAVEIPAAAADQECVMFRIQQAVAANNANNAGNLYVYSIALTGTAVKETPVEPGELDGKTVILHSNDVHGSIMTINDKGKPEAVGSLMGYANMAALAADYEAKGANVIIADAGDFSQGSTYVSTSKGLEAVNMMNAAGYDIATLGNHEFDYGYAQLTDNLKSAKFDVVCCNILDADGNLVFAPSKVVDVDGVKIGFIGVNTPESQTKANPALIQGLKWLSGEDMVKAVQAEADKLAETVDVTVVLAHLGVDDSSVPNTSYDLLRGLNGVDFIIDGHSHTVLKATAEKPIQSTGTAFNNIGVIVIDNEKKAIESNELVEITKDSAKDETVAAAAQAIIDKIDAEYGEVFAKSDVDLNGARSVDANGVYGNRDGETNLGDLITDSMVWQVKQNLDGITVPAENIVAITNGGGIRAAIAKGDITKKDVNTVLPFGNTIAVVYVTGAELIEALEASTYCSPASAIGGFPQVAGIEMTVDPDKAYDANEETYPGSTYYGPKTINRVTIDSINGKAFDEKATYAVITNNFLAAGGDTYYAFASASAQFDTGIPLDEALMSYIADELNGVVGQQYAGPQGRVIYPHTHDTELRNDKAPTCTEDGYTGDMVCKICGRVMEKGEPIEATGHDFEDGHGTCTICGFAPFSDIANSGYCDYIVVGWAAGIVGGYPDGTFRPNNEVTRGQFITMLWRACGEPEAENAELTFTDAANIPDDYKAAVAWGVEAGIIYGYGDNTFRHGTPISRAQMATFSYRLMDVIFEDGSFDAFKTPFGFNDDAAVAADYVDGVNVCANLGVITGYPDGFFRPNATGTRGQAATIILRLVLTIGELVEG